MRMLVGTRKGLFIYRGEGSCWEVERRAFIGDPVSLALHDPRDAALYAALNLGHFGCKLHRSEDGGASWQELDAPRYPTKPAGGDDPNPWSLQLIWALQAGAVSQPGRLWCGTIPGALFRSDDRGASWQLIESLWHREERLGWFGGGFDQAGIHSICIDPRDANTLTVGVSIGGVWRSGDNGASWTQLGYGLRADYTPAENASDLNQQDPHLLVQCAGAPDTFWTQHHNGIFVSHDNAHNWREIAAPAPVGFGFPVAVHPRDGNRAWFAPAQKDSCRVPIGGRFLVARTDNGGKGFMLQRRGLPQCEAWDLVYRHGLAVADDGETLAMGSTTGSLWCTGNGGSQWHAISHHLPPIACVRLLDD